MDDVPMNDWCGWCWWVLLRRRNTITWHAKKKMRCHSCVFGFYILLKMQCWITTVSFSWFRYVDKCFANAKTISIILYLKPLLCDACWHAAFNIFDANEHDKIGTKKRTSNQNQVTFLWDSMSIIFLGKDLIFLELEAAVLFYFGSKLQFFVAVLMLLTGLNFLHLSLLPKSRYWCCFT